jgi:DNA-binding response OmpR family regulator
MQILIVDDNEDDVDLALRALRETGVTRKCLSAAMEKRHSTISLPEGRFAGKPQNELPRLVLLDLKLPKVDGLEVLKEIRGNSALTTLPVVMLTSSHRVEAIWKRPTNRAPTVI